MDDRRLQSQQAEQLVHLLLVALLQEDELHHLLVVLTRGGAVPPGLAVLGTLQPLDSQGRRPQHTDGAHLLTRDRPR